MTFDISAPVRIAAIFIIYYTSN